MGPKTRINSQQRTTNKLRPSSQGTWKIQYVMTNNNHTDIHKLKIHFIATTTMETFCHEPLNIIDSCQVTFHPDYNKRSKKPPKNYAIISFFNIPAEGGLKLLTDFLDRYASTEGEPRYATSTYKEIQYKIRTITYKVTNILQHIPRYNTLFGRSINCYYNDQQKPTKKNQRTDYQSDQDENNEKDAQVLQQTIQPENTTINPDNKEIADGTDNINIQTNKETNQEKQ